jgi:2-methylcitrate dehydratase
VTPAQFEPQKLHDRKIREQLRKVEVVADPEIEKVFPALQRVKVRIDTTDGASYHKDLDYPKGDPRHPLTDEEIQTKFRALADGVINRKRQAEVIDRVWNLEREEELSSLMGLLKANVRKA